MLGIRGIISIAIFALLLYYFCKFIAYTFGLAYNILFLSIIALTIIVLLLGGVPYLLALIFKEKEE